MQTAAAVALPQRLGDRLLLKEGRKRPNTTETTRRRMSTMSLSTTPPLTSPILEMRQVETTTTWPRPIPVTVEVQRTHHLEEGQQGMS